MAGGGVAADTKLLKVSSGDHLVYDIPPLSFIKGEGLRVMVRQELWCHAF